jgi:hypothetical protein
MTLIHHFGILSGGGEMTLRTKYLMLFTISNQKKAKVAEMREDLGNDSDWKFIWRRRLFVWEEELLQNLKTDIQGFEWTQGGMSGIGSWRKDELLW